MSDMLQHVKILTMRDGEVLGQAWKNNDNGFSQKIYTFTLDF